MELKFDLNFFYVIILGCIFFYMSLNTAKKTKMFKKYKKYNDFYFSIYEKDTKLDEIEKYIEIENDNELLTKTKLVSKILKLDNNADIDYDINIEDLFVEKEKNNIKKLLDNADSFSLIMLILSYYKKNNLNSFITKLKNDLEKNNEFLKDFIEYKLIVALIEYIETENENVFVEKILEGDYVGYNYNKNYIARYKCIATVLKKLYNKQLIDIDYESLYYFLSKDFGIKFLKNIDMYDELDNTFKQLNKTEVDESETEVNEN